MVSLDTYVLWGFLRVPLVSLGTVLYGVLVPLVSSGTVVYGCVLVGCDAWVDIGDCVVV